MDSTEILLTSLTLDYEEYSEALHGGNDQRILTAREEAPWLQDMLSIDGIVLQVIQEGGANTGMTETSDEWVTGVFGLPGPSRVSVSGMELAPGNLAIIRPGEILGSTAVGVNRWCAISVPCQHFIQSVDRFDASAIEQLMSGPVGLRTFPTNTQRIVSLVESIMGVAGSGHGFESHTRMRAATSELLSEFVGAVSSSSAGRTLGNRRRRSQTRIIRHAREFLEVVGSHCSVADLAESAGVSERTLRIVFAENLGVSPKRLLLLRQLRAIRRDLQRASTGETVTKVALRHGVWELGRFANRYKYLFSEHPSETLRGINGL